MTVYAQGADYAFAPYPSAAELKAAGLSFVCRYLSGGNSKDITATELDGYLTGGINVVLNWETDGLMPNEAQGVADAQGAQSEVQKLATAVSAHSAAILAAPIIFSADFEPTTTSGIVEYMTGVVSVLGKARSGIYGGYAALDAVGDIVDWFWQTSAWSGGEVSSLAQIYQYGYNGNVSGITVDQDEALAENYGYIGASTPAPTPAPPAPSASPPDVGEKFPDINQGATGAVVEVIQYLLNFWDNAGLTVDGNFGPLTFAAVETFQTDHATSGGVNGGVGSGTWPWLVDYTVKENDTGDDVMAVQTALNAVDNAGLTVDGNDGPLTTAAIETFQGNNNISETGQVGGVTWLALIKAVAALAPAPTPPSSNPPSPAPTPTGETAQDVANYLAAFLTANGYTDMGAAGIITCVYGESALNPESVGSGGNGLIGWTPPLAGAVTGDFTKDLEFQAQQILVYNNSNDASHIAELNAQTSVEAAADYYSQVFERPAVTDSDVHAEGITIAEAAIASL